MKKAIAVILTMVLLLSCCLATAEEAGELKYDQLTVGVTTAFSGNFMSDALGSNISDQDIRKMIHSYHLVSWDGENGLYRLNDQVITNAITTTERNTYVFALARDLHYNDGTPITAKDYAFSFLLQTSKALQEAGGMREDGSRVLGWKAYDDGQAATVSGFRVIGDYQIAITIAEEYTPYFYDMKTLDIFPLPVHVLAPGYEVKDDGDGIYLSGALTADLLQRTILDPSTGYASHPSVTSGPYMMTNYDGKTVWLSLNPEYKGDQNGSKPYIENIVVRYTPSRDLLAGLIVGDLNLTVRSSQTEQVTTGMALARSDNFAMKTYSRNGLAFISFCGEKGPTADVNVRRAIAMCLDKETLASDYMGNMATPVNGYYGIGQWMIQITRGNIPESWIEEAPEGTDWSELNLNGLAEYPLDPAGAAALLDEAGWNLNAEGGAYTEGLRYKMENGQLVPLQLHLVYPNDNLAGPMLEELFAPYLREAGMEIEFTMLSMPALLKKFYSQDVRDCDMIMVGTNFQDVFDPSVYYDENGTDRLNGITDPKLAELAEDLRRTEPGDGAGYVRKWIAYLEYRSQVLPEIPLYSNAYMDFHLAALRDYTPGVFSSWSEALQYAYLSDYMPEEEAEEETGLEEGEEMFE